VGEEVDHAPLREALTGTGFQLFFGRQAPLGWAVWVSFRCAARRPDRVWGS
jgi:hypothetical protein